MADLALCPHCGKTISIPPDAAPDDRFLCPICQRGFSAAEAQLAPAAIPASAPKRLQVEYVTDTEARRLAPSSQSLRRRSRSSNWFGQLIGIVGGGVIGLTIGYCILLRLRGAEADFLEIRDRLPRWATGLPAEEEPILEDAPPANPSPPPPPSAEVNTEPSPPPESETSSSSPELPSNDSAEAPPGPALPADYLGPRDFTPRTSEELGAALVQANDALGCETCHSTGFVNVVEVTDTRVVDGRTIEAKQNQRAPCPACGGKPRGTSALAVFESFRELANVVTFVQADHGDPALLERRDAAEKLLRRVAGDTALAQNLGRIAGTAWEASDAAGQGILLIGTVKETAPEGKLFRTRLVLLGAPREVTVLSRRAPPFAATDRVAILGKIVDRPGEMLVGYDGQESRIVWGGLAVVGEEKRRTGEQENRSLE